MIIIRESTRQSIISDTYTFLTAIALILPGYLLDITALEWVGAVVFILVVFSMVTEKSKRMTINQARNYLDNLERENQ